MIKHGIPIYIRNTFAPHDAGTCIGTGGWGRSSGRSGAVSPTSVPVSHSCIKMHGAHFSGISNTTPGSRRCNCRVCCVQVEDTVRGFSNVDNLALFNLEGSGLVGVVGAASKLFACLHRGVCGCALMPSWVRVWTSVRAKQLM